ncbi:PAS domain-containing protein [Desulfobulbus rhabdoformis]|uniref:PAS domain-containing sensor histidine kinase n=1 Tax=Desulfobulbus rhabdoformis TaxID=34032 RepID=UPI001964F81F|nr:PAS domain-containing sensor histidine kinase [Desulfobulbus rhabdoformis]MBM9615209.1 PAS domain-containing protein [Desulfobulbus rhabdoformis]
MSLVLMVVVLLMGGMSYQRERQSLTVLLKEKGAAVIQVFEAGARTGMMGLLGNQAHLQTLLEETALRSDTLYITLADKEGRILAKSDQEQVGKTMTDYGVRADFQPGEVVQWRIRTDAIRGEVFEVYKRFLPTRDHGGGLHHRWHLHGSISPEKMECSPTWMGGATQEKLYNVEQPPTIIIGMDIKPYQRAINDEIRHNYIMAGIIFLVALAGVVSLFWTQSYLKNRRMLDDTRAFAAEIVRSLPVGMVVVGKTKRVLYINEVACSLLSVTRSLAEKKSLDQLLPAQLVPLLSEERPATARDGLEITLNREQQEPAVVQVRTSTVHSEEGHSLGFMCILQDVTQLRALERGLRQKEKLAAIGDLAAGIAHEIRNPLSSIKGYVTYFGSLFDKGSENREAAAIMAGEVDRVNRVISELLEFARPSDLKIKPTNLQTLIDHALRITSHDLQGAGVEVNLQYPTEPPILDLDPDRMTQVLLNLIINAAQAMPDGGRLSISVQQENSGLKLMVADTGKGICAEEKNNIFNPYFTTKKNGTGLGLAIVYKIVEDHGGRIAVQSTPGEGTTISLHLPAQKRDAA